MEIEVLGFAGCPNFVPAVERTREAVRETGVKAEIRELRVENESAANEARFPGSPTVRVNGLDVEIMARHSIEFGLTCRTYVADGIRQGAPPQKWITAAIREALLKENVERSREAAVPKI